MTAYALHLGQDHCHRVPILRTAGYEVEECATLDQLQSALEQQHPLDAIFVTEADDSPEEDAIAIARAYCSAPVILFRSSMRPIDESRFDLVVPTLSWPNDWLLEVEAMLAKTQKIHAQSEPAREEPIRIRLEAGRSGDLHSGFPDHARRDRDQIADSHTVVPFPKNETE